MRPNRQGLSTSGSIVGAAISATALLLALLLNAWTVMGQAFSPFPMSAGQWAYFFHIFTGAPLIGVLAFWLVPGSFVRRFACGAGLIAAEALGLMIAGAFAIMNYPAYPSVGPHELVAAATSLPAVLLPAVLAGVIGASGGSTSRWVLPTAVTAILLLGSSFFYTATVDQIDACLPVKFTPHERAVWNDIAGSFLHSVSTPSTESEAHRFAACAKLPTVDATGSTSAPFQVGFWTAEQPSLRWMLRDGDPFSKEGGCIFVAEYLATGQLQVNRNCGRL